MLLEGEGERLLAGFRPQDGAASRGFLGSCARLSSLTKAYGHHAIECNAIIGYLVGGLRWSVSFLACVGGIEVIDAWNGR